MPEAAVSASPFNILSGAAAETRPGKEAQAGTHMAHGPELVQNENSPKGRPGKESLAATHKHETTSRSEGDAREQQGRFARDDWQGAAHLLPTYLYDESTPRYLTTPKSSAYIKIAEGCDHPCTFCVIPNLRGKFRSRRFESVVAEARQLVARGVEEITLIGQDTTCYGEDLGLKDGLATLLDEMARVDGLRWLRFLYAYPNRITGRLLETIARHDNICKYLDVPLQHASPSVLKTMKRGAGAEIFLKTLEKVRAAVPGIALRTSFIVGFPGESTEDLTILEDFITEAKFDWLGVFGYSDEEGSAAFPLEGKLPKRTIEARKKRVMKLQQKISKRAKQQWVGRELLLLAEGESEETPLLWEGRTEFHAPEIDGKVYINDFGELDAPVAGRFYRAEITEAHDYDLVARIVSEAV
jgi:ribosomal protein S12 methylthiotransferase